METDMNILLVGLKILYRWYTREYRSFSKCFRINFLRRTTDEDRST